MRYLFFTCLLLTACAAEPVQPAPEPMTEEERRFFTDPPRDKQSVVESKQRAGFCEDCWGNPELGAIGQCQACPGETPSCSRSLCATCGKKWRMCVGCGDNLISLNEGE